MKGYNFVENSVVREFNKTIWKNFLKGIKSYQLIENGDKIAVCISGGKDSMLMANCLQRWQYYGNIDFSVEFIVMNPGYSKENTEKISFRFNADLVKNILLSGMPKKTDEIFRKYEQ